MIKAYAIAALLLVLRALRRARAARRRRRTGRGGRRRRAGAGRGRRRGFRRLYRRAFDIAVVGTRALASITAPEASLERTVCAAPGRKPSAPATPRSSGQCAGSRLTGAIAAQRHAAAAPAKPSIPAGPDARLSALTPRRGTSRWLPARLRSAAAAPRSRVQALRPPPWRRRCRAACAAANSGARRSRCDRRDWPAANSRIADAGIDRLEHMDGEPALVELQRRRPVPERDQAVDVLVVALLVERPVDGDAAELQHVEAGEPRGRQGRQDAPAVTRSASLSASDPSAGSMRDRHDRARSQLRRERRLSASAASGRG